MKWMTSCGHVEKGLIVQQSIFFSKYLSGVFGATILLEKHTREHCNSFCCSQKNRTLKLFLPECKASNAWRWLVYYGRGKYNYCLSWTLPSFKRWMVRVRYRMNRMRSRPRVSGVSGVSGVSCGEITNKGKII